MRRAVFGQKWRDFLGVGGVYRTCFDKNGIVLVHIPKTAGTSIANAIYGADPWHYSAKELRFINKRKYDEYFKFSIVRNPWGRIYSSFKYADLDIERYPESSLSFVKNYSSFSSFVMNGLSEDLVQSHYFFWPQVAYLNSIDNTLAVDYVGKFENLAECIQLVSEKMGERCLDVPHMNRTGKGDSLLDVYSNEMVKKVSDLYQADLSAFGYSESQIGNYS